MSVSIPQRLGLLLAELTATRLTPPSDLRLLPDVRALWADAVGEPLAAHTMPVRYAEGCLVVNADSSVWSSKVLFQRQTLSQRLRREPLLAELRTLHVRVRPPVAMPISAPVSAPESQRTGLSSNARCCVAGIAQDIGDSALREALFRLARPGA
jgi:hypothetical protein